MRSVSRRQERDADDLSMSFASVRLARGQQEKKKQTGEQREGVDAHRRTLEGE
jgi:hypothetical protein